ncbi:MAG: hypothetical protein C5B58_06880 [Acidobacteria bacterium]|nr:MAG: hypothetical protein C5B58_06880 [Acidobacteriota bacterium]
MKGSGWLGWEVEKELLEDWDLDLEEDRRCLDLGPLQDRSPPRVVHKIRFSMPAGTMPNKFVEAVKDFARRVAASACVASCARSTLLTQP